MPVTSNPTKTDVQQRADELYAELVGSSQDLPDEVENDTDLALALDELTLRCHCCDWWVDADETEMVNDEPLCLECLANEEEE